MEVKQLTTESDLQHRRLWLIMGWTLVLLVVYLSLTPDPIRVPVEEGDKVGHVLAYGTLMIWFANLYPSTVARVAFALGFVAAGVALEFVQRWTGYRSFEVADMIADAAGVAAGWVIAFPRLPNFFRGLESIIWDR